MFDKCLADHSGHRKPAIAVDVDLADVGLRRLAELLFRNTDVVLQFPAVFVDHLHIFRRNRGRAVQDDGEAGKPFLDFGKDVEAERRRDQDAVRIAGALLRFELAGAME